jgi:3'-phosphoadenosine 5'-phosphosulfate sulfotransferase (PAPS reductase)/FAD synthetase
MAKKIKKPKPVYTFSVPKPEPEEIVATAIRLFKPVAIVVGYTGGGDSTVVKHWMTKNVPGCKVFLANTGIGIEAARQWVRDECRRNNDELIEIRAKEDCGEDYDELVKEFGFPGPDHHQKMYDRLKGRAVGMMVRNAKRHRMDRVMIASGIRHDESLIRMGYAGSEINKVGAQVWVNPIYWWSKQQCNDYIAKHNLSISPIAKALGMSGECGCGAYAHPGELNAWRRVDPAFGERIDRLQLEVLDRGFTWGWDMEPPAGGHNKDQGRLDPTVMNAPLCGAGCMRSAVVQEELNEERST